MGGCGEVGLGRMGCGKCDGVWISGMEQEWG